MEQAKNAAKLLEMGNFTLILSSSLIRAYKTAEIIADQAHNPITIIEELKEVSLGIREGD